MESPPTGTVTFLFSDIEGSTRRWQDEPDAMRALLTEHDAIWREVIEKHRGHLFKHTGDGVAAVFASAADACAAAVDAQARLAGVLPVRVGLHTGEAELRDGDYFGSTLNRCARLMGIAHGGQIVCSAATAELVRDRDDLRDLGEHRLRDLSRGERVWQVGAGEFPALRSLTAASTNLPFLLSSFVGREAEMAELVAAVGESRLVTLTGVGGVGKTRLALQVAGEVLPGFVDGVWLAELAAAANGDEMVQVVALALGVVQRQQMTLAESIVDFLRTREMLVVLDNCEHLLDDTSELVEDVLAGAPKVRVLATSREGFGIPGEAVRPLRSLAATEQDAESSDAVVLFVERARAVKPGIVLDTDAVSIVVELCRRLDGIPLAIELAAARVATMTPAEIVGHLDERFRLLTGGRRGRVERHQTLRAAIEWSYSLLEETERAVFDRLGVFPASFDEAAAVAVCAGDGVERWDVIDAMAGLATKSMVNTEQHGDVTRYQLLETLRHFSRDRADDLDELRRRHARHFAGVAEAFSSGLRSPDEFAWRPRLVAELDNLRAAAGWAFDAAGLDDVGFGVRIIDALLHEAGDRLSWGIQAWAAPGLARVDDLEAAQRATLFTAASQAEFLLGDLERARQLAARALADTPILSNAHDIAIIWLCIGEAALGDPAAAMDFLAEARALVESDPTSNKWRAAGLPILVSTIALMAGDHDTARSQARLSVSRNRALSNPSMLAHALVNEGHVLCTQSPTEALALLDEAMPLLEAGLVDSVYSGALLDVAFLRAPADLARAARAASTAIGVLARTGNRSNIADAIAMAAFVTAAHPAYREVAVTLDGARRGPLLGHIPALFTTPYQPRLDATSEDVVAGLDPAIVGAAQRRGAAMTYDEVTAYALEQLARIAVESEASV